MYIGTIKLSCQTQSNLCLYSGSVKEFSHFIIFVTDSQFAIYKLLIMDILKVCNVIWYNDSNTAEMLAKINIF